MCKIAAAFIFKCAHSSFTFMNSFDEIGPRGNCYPDGGHFPSHLVDIGRTGKLDKTVRFCPSAHHDKQDFLKNNMLSFHLSHV